MDKNLQVLPVASAKYVIILVLPTEVSPCSKTAKLLRLTILETSLRFFLTEGVKM